ncbi:hypothetical protein RJ639_009458 [Escallonia herrerae]|uniref:DUF4408 domain-containing protein n=1 Tax=Escallonia herrerae TaxID=1293975 RepID=A0AA89ASE1_9ASTE|nr:hypothetical protein RJ639_009458 [Escallonia herrerae]
MAPASNLMMSLKFLLIAAGVVSIAVAMKLSVPVVIEVVPAIWSAVRSWLKPPYLYVVINGIIITIVASSRLYQKQDDSEPVVQPKAAAEPDLQADFAPVLSERDEDSDLDLKAAVVNGSEVVEDFAPVPLEPDEDEVLDVKAVVVNGSEVVGDEDENEHAISTSTWSSPQRIEALETLLPTREKPLVSSRFSHRRIVKTSPEGGKALRVAKPKRHETLENTWKAITDGRHVPLTRHMRKSDTFENHGRQLPNADVSVQSVLKSETFRDRTKYDPSKLRKEASLGQDELNRRVEAFISKFNEEMRLQRQESLNRYTEMINRGAH